MRTAKSWLLALLLPSPAAFPLSGNVVATDNVKAHLVSEVSAIAPGQSFWVALEFNIRDGWHTYWRNPGDSGQATTLKWQLPPGFTAGDAPLADPNGTHLHPRHTENFLAASFLQKKTHRDQLRYALELGHHEDADMLAGDQLRH